MLNVILINFKVTFVYVQYFLKICTGSFQAELDDLSLAWVFICDPI